MSAMNRRRFLGLFGAFVGGVVLDQAIPLNRVWSFPKQIVILKCRQPGLSTVTIDAMNALTIRHLTPIIVDNLFRPSPLFAKMRNREPYLFGGVAINLPLTMTM